MKPFIICLALFFLSACNLSVKPEQLFGTWKYVKVENLTSHELLPEYEIAAQSPIIVFSKNYEMKIIWGGETLSSGNFKIDGNKILVTEYLSGGKTREFPFLVSQIDGKNIVFETISQGGSRVTAVKE